MSLLLHTRCSPDRAVSGHLRATSVPTGAYSKQSLRWYNLARNMSNIVVFSAEDLSGHDHVVLGTPIELEYKANDAGGKGLWHSVPIRSRVAACNGKSPSTYPSATDSENVAVTDGPRSGVKGLKRLAIRLRNVWVQRISSFGEQDGQGDDNKVQMSISLTGRDGTSPEEQAVVDSLDSLTAFIRRIMVQCRDIRTPLKIAPGMTISDENVDGVAAGVLDSVKICRTGGGGGERRFMYPKVNLAPGFFRTQLYAPNGTAIPIAIARAWSSGTTARDVIVELESITCTKLVKTIRMRVLEASLDPPASRDWSTRSSLLFPDRTIPPEEQQDEDEDSQTRKRKRGEEEELPTLEIEEK